MAELRREVARIEAELEAQRRADPRWRLGCAYAGIEP
jgi:hypothetical protein